MGLRIPAQCPRCHPAPWSEPTVVVMESGYWFSEDVETADISDGKLILHCSAGHETVAKIPASQFELLFEFGCSALVDGYSREAITCFASSIERFHEFASRFLLAQRGLTREDVENWWRQVKRQSERQLGSFLALWLAEFGSEPPVLPQKMVELRNQCVHQGRIPPVGEAKQYGEAVLRAVVGGIVMLRNRFFDSRQCYLDFVAEHIDDYDDEPIIDHGLFFTVIEELWLDGEPISQMPGPAFPDDPAGLSEAEQRAFNEAYDKHRVELSMTHPKNTLEADVLTIDQALTIFKDMCSSGHRRR
jgi:hypothetical protein